MDFQEKALMQIYKMAITISCFLLLAPSQSFAEKVAACVKGARDDAKVCIQGCRDDRKADILNCRVPDGECGDGCKAGHLECTSPIQEAKEACLDESQDTFDAARSQCAADNSCEIGVDCRNNDSYNSCVTDAAEARAVSNVACRRDSERRAEFKTCNKILRACSKACKG